MIFASTEKNCKMNQRSKGMSNVERKWGFRYPKGSGEMFGPAKAFTNKYLKTLNTKRRGWQICGGLVTICIFAFIFTVSPKHLDIRLPTNEDLLETPMLRGQDVRFDYDDNHYLKRRIVEFLLESCEQLKTYDILFCHNVLVNGQPLQEPCFVMCKEKSFYANVDASTTDDDPSTIVCTETYADLTVQKKRHKTIVLKGQRFHSNELEGKNEMIYFTKVPKTLIDTCIFQHAVEIVEGKWIASE